VAQQVLPPCHAPWPEDRKSSHGPETSGASLLDVAPGQGLRPIAKARFARSKILVSYHSEHWLNSITRLRSSRIMRVTDLRIRQFETRAVHEIAPEQPVSCSIGKCEINAKNCVFSELEAEPSSFAAPPAKRPCSNKHTGSHISSPWMRSPSTKNQGLPRPVCTPDLVLVK
jgi:hypothetical protein